MSPAELNQLLDEAFERWSAMTGFDPESRFYNEKSKQARDIQETRQLDPSGLTTFMLMKAYTERFIEEETVSCLELIRGLSEEKSKRIDLLRDMLTFLERPDVDEIIELFIESIRDAVDHYGVDHDDLEAWLGNYYWLAVLRRDALRSFKKLEVHQFYHGKPSENERIVMGSKVMEFWNVPSLIRGMMAMGRRGLRGVNLCLIRDPLEALHSFWVITAVNGESLTILTDRGREAHPGARYRFRRPDREFSERSSKHWFPYELLEIEQIEDPDDPDLVIRLKAAERDQLVPINAEAVALTEFSKLFPSDVIWLSLLFGLVADRYLVDNEELPEKSYTTEMIRNPNLLLSARPEIVPHSTYKALEAPELTLEDITAEKTKSQWGREPVGHNEWMIDLYGADVPKEAFNVLGPKELKELPRSMRPVDKSKLKPWQSAGTKLKALDPIGFGTGTSVQNDRLWIARYNLCTLVQREVMAEFEESVDWVLKWYRKKVMDRRGWIIERSVLGEFVVQREQGIRDIGSKALDGERRIASKNIVNVRLGNDYTSARGWGHIYRAIHMDPAPRGTKGSYYECAETQALSIDYHAIFRPQTAEELALILGRPFESLPWQLQRWSFCHDPKYTGNSMLERCDPSDWVLQNPWSADGPGQSMGMEVIVHLSRRGVNAVRKRLGLPKFDWKAEHVRQEKEGY